MSREEAIADVRPPTSDLRPPTSNFFPPAAAPLRILIVAGEVSGDMHAAALMRALQAQHG